MKLSDMLISLILLILVVIFYLLDNYYGHYVCFSIFLLYSSITSKKVNVKLLSLFFLMYFIIPFLKISTYRGNVDIYVMGIYTLTIVLVLLMVSILEKNRNVPDSYYGFYSTRLTELLFIFHIGFIYLLVLYVYATKGIIIIRQDLRFTISPAIEYLIKSGLVLPLIWIFSFNFKPNLDSALKKLLMPIIPSLLIGSRGTFIMIVISIIFALYLYKVYGPAFYVKRYGFIYQRSRVFMIVAGVLCILALYTGFYIRRDGIELITANELLYQYEFVSSGFFVKSILPLYIGLKESVGISNRLIMDNIFNPADYPLFFMEMITFLPGHQEAPGIILARDIYMASGSDEKYSLTPGIVGGLYIDYGLLLIPIIVSLTALLVLIYNKGINDMRFRMIYVLSIVQYFHLYHRGFLKLEYFVPYFVMLVFFVTLNKIKIER